MEVKQGFCGGGVEDVELLAVVPVVVVPFGGFDGGGVFFEEDE